MSIRLMTMVFERYPEGGSEMLLALAMVDHARDDGTRIWPSLEELARKTRQSRRTVQRQIAKMVGTGWLEQVRTATGRPGATNEYRVNAAWVAGEELPQRGVNLSPLPTVPGETMATSSDETAGNSTELERGDRLTPVPGPSAPKEVIHTGDRLTPVDAGERGVTRDERGVTGDARGDTAMTPESSGTIRNHTPLPPGGGANGFEDLWSIYPNHDNRAKAERRYRRLAPDAALQQTMRSAIEAQRLGRRWTGNEGDFVPEFANWLRNKRWFDEPRQPLMPAAGPWDATRSGIEAKGQALGVGRWDEQAYSLGRGETFRDYTMRVRQQVEQEEGALCESR